MNPRAIVAFLVLVAGAFLPFDRASAQRAEPERRRQHFPWLPDETVVEHISLKLSYGSISNWAFTVSRDGTVNVFRWEQENLESRTPLGKPVLEGTYGRRVERSGDLELGSLLPLQEVPVQADRFRVSPSLTAHVVLTWGFNKNDSLGNDLAYSIYVFHENATAAELAYADKWVNLRLRQLSVEDLNGDGIPEIVDVGTFIRGACMRIRTVDSTGKVSLVQKDICGYEVRLERSEDGKLAKIILREGRWDEKVTPYAWSPGAQKFIVQTTKRKPH